MSLTVTKEISEKNPFTDCPSRTKIPTALPPTEADGILKNTVLLGLAGSFR